jgi:lipid kinase, YegS/Rv2252/BmrU family
MKCLFIINPSSGRRTIQKTLDKMIGQLILEQVINSVDVFYTEKKDDAYHRTSNLNKDSYNFIVAVGGDGTINEVIGGIIKSESQIPLAIIAAGTVNDFANYLKLPKNINTFLEMIKDFEITKIDIGKINNQYFSNVIAGGLLSDIGFKVDKQQKALLGSLAYYIEGALSLPSQLSSPIHVCIQTENKTFDEEAFLFLISNTKSVGGFKQLIPIADVSDGLFDILIIKKCEITDLIALSKDILLNKHIHSPFIEYFQASQITISTNREKEIILDMDGEKGPILPITITNLHKALNLIIPKNI